MKKFVTIFLGYRNFHFYKDPGQIPYRFKNKGWEAELVCFKNEKSYLPTEKHLPVMTVPATRFNLGLIWYLVKTARKIDVINVYHFEWESILTAFIYKCLNPKGLAYLKMDNCHNSGIYPWEKIFDKKLLPVSFLTTPRNSLKWGIKKLLIKNFFLRKIDVFSVEDEDSKNYFDNKYAFFKNKLIVVYNGHTIDLANKDIKLKSFEEKENLIITVGRLGTFQKNTLNLLRGFAATAKKHNWNLILAGNLDSKFVSHKDDFFKLHPELKNRISFVGNLEKPELFDLYNRAKIFILPSKFETFALVYSEAAFFGNSIITTPYTSVKDLITREKLGLLVEPESTKGIGDAIIELISDEENIKRISQNAHNFALANLNWDDITDKLQNEFQYRNCCVNET